jgi:hypothetical protein
VTARGGEPRDPSPRRFGRERGRVPNPSVHVRLGDGIDETDFHERIGDVGAIRVRLRLIGIAEDLDGATREDLPPEPVAEDRGARDGVAEAVTFSAR